MPRTVELDDPAGVADPLDEVAHSPVKNVIRVYPDRIAFCVNNECALYCRFCLRKRMVGDEEWTMKKRELEVGLDWIRRTPAIRDVLLTGGDPLVFSDDKLEWLLAELRAIPHVEIVRLGTRLPVTLPFRVTDALCRMLERYHPIWVNTHFNHPKELTPEAAEALRSALRAGIPVGNQSVLLGGINDDAATMKALCEGLVRMRVRPYYCYQAQLLEGTAHFRVPIERGVELFRELRGRTSGFAIPHLRARHAVRQGAARLPVPARARRRPRRGRGLRRARLAGAQPRVAGRPVARARPSPGARAGGEGAAGLQSTTAIPIGAAVEPDLLESDVAYAETLAREFGSLAPENAMKWALIHPAESAWRWEPADRLVAFARAHGMIVHAHTLVWHRQLPDWVRAVAPERLGRCSRITSGRLSAATAARSHPGMS